MLETIYTAPKETIDISNCPLLKELYLTDSEEFPLTELDLSNNPALEIFTLSGGRVDVLDFSNNPRLHTAGFRGVLTDSINLPNATALESLFIETYGIKRLYVNGAELAEFLRLSPNTISHHINKLQSNGLIFSESEGNRIYYAVNRSNIKLFIRMLSEMFLGDS